MRKGMKRFMSMGLGAVIALTGTGASAMCVQAADDPVEISIAYWDADSAFVGDDVLSEIEDKLNIKITPVNITWDDYTQKIQLWASSGSLPDVFAGDFRNLYRLGNSGRDQGNPGGSFRISKFGRVYVQ